MAPLVRIEPSPDGDLDDLRSRLTALEAALGARELEVARAKADLGAFRLRYRQEVGLLHDELDDLVEGSDPDATRARLVRRIAQIESRLEAAASELAALQDTPLWKLKVIVDEAAGRGKDLVRDMVRGLKRDILVARNRLDAIQSLP